MEEILWKVFIFLLFVWSVSSKDTQLYVVTAPVSNLCVSPKPWTVSYQIDYNAETQLLYNEILSLLPNSQPKDGYILVKALQQLYD